MFRIGQKIVCVDASSYGQARWPSKSALTEGQIYTVRSFGVTLLGSNGLKLEEIRLTSDPGHCGFITGKVLKDSPYRASRFRPLVERKTNISIFTELLTDTKIPALTS